ncbi:hypothetical protein LOK49_LG11G02072 [Camellia lanceoleosa]|uniref:Uncharacterized protein n=1 Tax=Camellia lanceoleosa TaxID=1840588 RepID=A0ACC0G0X9_9ERIC|nr:hypothetical protein LOK49_LG11G02072 [Camellia lanceoleosa]
MEEEPNPEHPYSLEELKVISEDAIEVDDKHNCVRVTFTPTVEHCNEVRACAEQVVQDQHCLKMQKKLQQLKAPKKKQLQATKLSVEGRGMVKYLVLSMGLCMK